MNNTQIIADRIKTVLKTKNVTIKQLLTDCELGINTITKMSNGTDITSQHLLKIADYLDISVDYLLGRTECDTLLTLEEQGIINQHRQKQKVDAAVKKFLDI